MDQNTAKKLIDKTRDDYNLIAEQFASTRKYNWSDTLQSIQDLNLKNGDVVLDLGCGNGRLYELLTNNKIEYYGIDISKKLVEIAKKNVTNGNFMVGDMTNIPLEDNFFDLVVSIAVLHHIPTDKLREQSVKEIFRVAKPGGKVMLTVWFFWETKKYLKMIENQGKVGLPTGDFLMPWKNGKGEVITERYFHAWKINELEALFKKSGFINIDVRKSLKSSGLPGYNLITVAEKPK
jgi:ubiquinone/menaquinone biosynthesis C-methylase UbiE